MPSVIYGMPEGSSIEEMLKHIGPGLPLQRVPGGGLQVQRRTMGTPPRQVPPVASGTLPAGSFSAMKMPDVSLGLPGASGVTLAPQRQPDLPLTNPAANPSAIPPQLSSSQGAGTPAGASRNSAGLPGVAPPGANAADATSLPMQSSFDAANQRLNQLETQGPPRYHGFKRFFDTLARMTPYGALVEGAAGIGTIGYQNKLEHAQNDVDFLEQQLNRESSRQYQTPRSAQSSQAIPSGWGLHPNDGTHPGEGADQDQKPLNDENPEEDENSPLEIPLGAYDFPQNPVISALNPDQSAALKKKAPDPRELWTFYR